MNNFTPTYTQYHLVFQYFGSYLERLLEAQQRHPYEGRFFLLAFNPETFENRLARIEALGQTDAIVLEVGKVTDPVELDRRLMAAWAELRVCFQLFVEGFQNIQKVKDVADFTASCGEQNFAFQVKRIQSSLRSKTNRKQSRTDLNTFGKTVDQIQNNLTRPVGDFFWDALREKNGNFKSAKYEGWQRCIVIVSGDEDLQDAMVRHIACQQMRSGIHDPGMGKIHFEHLLWLPDLSAGAWFVIGNGLTETRCFADWKDVPGEPGFDLENAYRREVYLDRDYYGWRDPERIYRICQ